MNRTDRPPLLIPADLHEAMVTHCLRESPLECCGLLGGVAPLVSSFHPMRNALARSETRYDADPRDLIEAVQSLRARKAEILAIYHSHPAMGRHAQPDRPRSRTTTATSPGSSSRLLEPTIPEVRVWRLDVGVL